MGSKSRYARGREFPNEGFVQNAVESHFSVQGFQPEPGGDADFVCRHPVTGERWVVEVKGATSSIGLDFRTGLGQIVQRMTDPSTRYAVSIPAIPQFLEQCRLVNDRVRVALNLHWLIVGKDGSIRVCGPADKL